MQLQEEKHFHEQNRVMRVLVKGLQFNTAGKMLVILTLIKWCNMEFKLLLTRAESTQHS